MSRLATIAAAVSNGRPGRVWPPPPRAPLPPFPTITASQPPPPQAGCWAAQAYINQPAAQPPPKPDLYWHRGNFQPWLPEGVTRVYSDLPMILSWDLVRMSAADQVKVLDKYANVDGYTHIVLSRPQTLNFGLELPDLLATAWRCKQAGLFVIVVAVSDGDSFSAAVPWLRVLSDARVVDIVCGCWQVDKYYEPDAIVQLALDGGQWCHARNILTGMHWGGGYPGWAENCAAWDADTARRKPIAITDRGSFFRALEADLDFQYGQCNTEADIDQVQSWGRKIMAPMPASMRFVPTEYDQQAQFDDPANRLEVYGDMKGLLATYIGTAGYLGGARQRNGSVW